MRNTEMYRSGHNGLDSKSSSPSWARGFESHRLRHSKKTPLRGLFSMTKTDGSTSPTRARAARDWANTLAKYDTYLLRHQSL